MHPMNLQQHHLSSFSHLLAEYCSVNGVFCDECESMVDKWTESVEKSYRPTTAGVIMNAKRLRWGTEILL